MITIHELAETYNLKLPTIENHSRNKQFAEFFTIAKVPSVVKKRGSENTIVVERKRVCIYKNKIEKYLIFKEAYAKHSDSYSGWTNASVFCFKRGMNCQGCDLWARNCEQRAKEFHQKTPPIKEKVLELVRDFGEPPQFLLERV